MRSSPTSHEFSSPLSRQRASERLNSLMLSGSLHMKILHDICDTSGDGREKAGLQWATSCLLLLVVERPSRDRAKSTQTQPKSKVIC